MHDAVDVGPCRPQRHPYIVAIAIIAPLSSPALPTRWSRTNARTERPAMHCTFAWHPGRGAMSDNDNDGNDDDDDDDATDGQDRHHDACRCCCCCSSCHRKANDDRCVPRQLRLFRVTLLRDAQQRRAVADDHAAPDVAVPVAASAAEGRDGGRSATVARDKRRVPDAAARRGDEDCASSWLQRCHDAPMPMPTPSDMGHTLPTASGCTAQRSVSIKSNSNRQQMALPTADDGNSMLRKSSSSAEHSVPRTAAIDSARPHTAPVPDAAYQYAGRRVSRVRHAARTGTTASRMPAARLDCFDASTARRRPCGSSSDGALDPRSVASRGAAGRASERSERAKQLRQQRAPVGLRQSGTGRCGVGGGGSDSGSRERGQGSRGAGPGQRIGGR